MIRKATMRSIGTAKESYVSVYSLPSTIIPLKS